MTHFDALVCLPPTEPGDVRGAIAAAMAPYDAGTGLDPEESGVGEWDRWFVDGNFLVRPPFDHDPAIIREPAWPSGEARVYEPLRCDGGPVRMLDIPAMRTAARERGRRDWAAWSTLLARYPRAQTLADLTARHGDGAWEAFAAQPLVRAVREQPPESPLHTAPFDNDPVEYFGDDEETFLAALAAAATNAYAVVTLDGDWLDYDSFAGPARDFTCWQADYVDELPADAVIVMLSCHI